MKHSSHGFTLLEVIAVLLIIGVLGAMMVSTLGSNFFRSSVPISRLQTTLTLQQSMENITAAYNATAQTQNDLTTLQANILAGDFTTDDQDVTAVLNNDFDATTDHDPPVLQVTLTDNNTGESLSALFSQY